MMLSTVLVHPLLYKAISHHWCKFDPIDREALNPPTVSQNKDGIYQCKKHGSPSMSFGVFQ
jgi:hypothetical protein